jgi:hypothetical protein
LRDRITSIMLKPSATVKLGDFYVPEPRRLMAGCAATEVARRPIKLQGNRKAVPDCG